MTRRRMKVGPAALMEQPTSSAFVTQWTKGEGHILTCKACGEVVSGFNLPSAEEHMERHMAKKHSGSSKVPPKESAA